MIYFDYCCEERSCPLHFDIHKVYASTRFLLASYILHIKLLLEAQQRKCLSM